MIQKTLQQWWKNKIANLVSEIDDCVSTSFGNTSRRPITGPMWVPKDRGKLLLAGKVMLTLGSQSKVFGMAVARAIWCGFSEKVGTPMAAEMMGGESSIWFSTNVCVCRIPTDVLTQQ